MNAEQLRAWDDPPEDRGRTAFLARKNGADPLLWGDPQSDAGDKERVRRLNGGDAEIDWGGNDVIPKPRPAPPRVQVSASGTPLVDEPKWDEPSPLARQGDLMTFPTTVYPEWLRSFVEGEAAATQTPVDMAALFSLAALATLAAGHVQIEPKDGWVEGLNAFVAVGMDPGERKSVVHRDVTAPILEYEKTLRETAQPNISERASIRRIAETALARAEKAAATTKDSSDRKVAEEEAHRLAKALERLDVPTPPRLFTDDCTPEKLASLLFENGGRIAVLSAEGGIFDQMAGRYATSVPNLDVYLKGHAGDPLRVDRVGRPFEYVDHPALTVGVAVQPFVLVKAAGVVDFKGRGLIDRFWYGLPRGKVGFRDTTVAPLAPATRFRYDTTMRAFAETFNGLAMPASLHLDKEALATFQDWMAEIEPRRRPDADLGHLRGWASKLDGAIPRIAGLLHLAETFTGDWHAPVSDQTLASAISVGNYLIDHALAVFDEMGADPARDGARLVLAWIRREHLTAFTRRECHRSHRARFRRPADLDPVLNLLVEHDYIREPARPPRLGRPSRQFEVNPQTWGQNEQNGQNG
jgi:hypothetical protein